MPIQKTSAAVPAHIREAINTASQETGASFDYLLNTAMRESSFREDAQSSSSSASGLFQFVESTWLRVVKEEGDRLGLGDFAKQIKRTSRGQYYVPDRNAREKVLDLRNDPEASALIAGAYTEHNAQYVASRIGRQPNEGELYLAHFLGPGHAAKMIELVDAKPDQPASRYFAAAANANKPIFYEEGNPRTVSEVYDILISSHNGNSSYGNSRSTRYGPLDFGVMGGLMGDVQSSSGLYGKGGSGSIGVWGGSSTATTASSSTSGSSAELTEKSRSRSSRSSSRNDTASNTARHRQVAEQYASQQHISSQGGSGSGWKNDAFGGGD